MKHIYKLFPLFGILFTTAGFFMMHTAASDDGWLYEQRQYEQAVEQENTKIKEALAAIEIRLRAEGELVLAKKDSTTNAAELRRLAGKLTSVQSEIAALIKEGVWLAPTTTKK